MEQLKNPKDFESYKAWKNADSKKSYRPNINNVKSELEQEQKRYTKLEKQKRKLYSGSSDFEKTKQVKDDFEQCEKNIEKLQKKISDLQKEADEAELEKQKLKQEFLEDVAESGYLVELGNELMEALEYAQEVNNVVRKWDVRELSLDLYSPTPAHGVKFDPPRQYQRIEDMKERLERIANGDYQHNDLKRLTNQ